MGATWHFQISALNPDGGRCHIRQRVSRFPHPESLKKTGITSCALLSGAHTGCRRWRLAWCVFPFSLPASTPSSAAPRLEFRALPPFPASAPLAPNQGAGLFPPQWKAGRRPGPLANRSAGAGVGSGGAGCDWPAGLSGAKFEGDIKGRRRSRHSVPLLSPPPCCPPAPRSLPATTSPACRPRRACHP